MTSGGSQRKGGGSVGAGGGSGRSGSRAVEEIVRHQVGDISINQRPHVLHGETRKLASQALTEQQPALNHNNSEIKKVVLTCRQGTLQELGKLKTLGVRRNFDGMKMSGSHPYYHGDAYSTWFAALAPA